MTELVGEGLTVRVARRTLVEDVSFRLRPGRVVAILGPNGAGKSTLLRAALGLLRRHAGTVRLGGRDPARLSPRDRARRVAYLPQARPVAWPGRVRDLVALGRFAHGAVLGRLAGADEAAVARALEACELEALGDRRADTLSGGEIARVHCARAFAAETPLLVADEPVASLDPLHQLRTMGLFRDFAAAGGGALVVLHDLALAARFADEVMLLRAGRTVAAGPVSEVLDERSIEAVFGIRARVSMGPDGLEIVTTGLP